MCFFEWVIVVRDSVGELDLGDSGLDMDMDISGFCVFGMVFVDDVFCMDCYEVVLEEWIDEGWLVVSFYEIVVGCMVWVVVEKGLIF